MTTEEHLKAAKEWRLSAIANRNYQGKTATAYFNDSPLEAAHRCELRADYHEQFIEPSDNHLTGYYND